MNSKTKVILVTTYFPPLISVASNRMEAFAKYLNHDCYDLDVVTLKHDNTSENIPESKKYTLTELTNDSFFKKASFDKTNSFIIHKAKAAYNKLLAVFVKNEHSSWQRKVEKHIEKCISQNPSVIVISSFAPVAPHMAILNLKRKDLKFHWIADFRDSMTNPAISNTLIDSYRKIQKDILQYADAISTVSEPIIKEFSRIVPSASNRIFEIRNGYDFSLPTETSYNPEFTISYIGTFYGSRKPNYFFKALKSFMDKNVSVDIRLQLIGVGSAIQIPDFIQNNIFVTNKVSHEEALEYMFTSDALLLLHPQNNYKGVYTGKVFEYLASLKPIIAAVDKEDVAAKLIEECNAGFIAAYENIEEIEQAINNAYQLWNERKQLNLNIPLIKEQHRKIQAGKLDSIIQDYIGKL